MASAPPESIILSSFAGVKNTVGEERLATGELSAAVNVDIDDAGQLRRRRGYIQKDGANYHSLSNQAGKCFVVKDGTLGTLDFGYNFAPLTFVGDDPLDYTSVGSTVYFSSRDTSGKIVLGEPEAWGIDDGGRWVSPVMRPTDTLGAISGRLLEKPPRASLIESYRGRIYLADGNVLWATELYLYDLIDKSKNFYQLDHAITMIAAAADGLYVGTEQQLLFLQGTFSKGLSMDVVMETPVVRGSVVQVPYSKAHPQARTSPVPEGYGPMFMTGTGICLGLPSGQVFNLTQDRVVFPGAVSAAALYREDQGATSYVAVADSAGGPSANARIGDYVDAEIVRASQRG
jgi:hypothetical protein